jgi:hypothetical protein
MPPIRNHPRHSRNGAIAAGDHATACDRRTDRGCGAEPADFIEQTVAIWQKRTDRRLTREDGREIIENMTGFFSVLQEWDRKERTAENVKAALPTTVAARSPRTARKV